VSQVGILARPDLGEAGPTLRDLIRWLRERGVGVCLEERSERRPWKRESMARASAGDWPRRSRTQSLASTASTSGEGPAAHAR